MTNTLTAEQIAQGWIAYTGQSLDPLTLVQVYTPGGGWEFGMAGDFDFTQPTDDDYDIDPIGAANNFITRYRTFSPDLPSPPVSGEAVNLEWVGTDGNNLSYNGKVIAGIDYSKSNGGFYVMTWLDEHFHKSLTCARYGPLEDARSALKLQPALGSPPSPMNL